MSDGTRLAVSSWLPKTPAIGSDQLPVLLTTTRYWRAVSYRDDRLEDQISYHSAHYFYSQGYITVTLDARGSGASFGHRESEISPIEIEDIAEVVDWIAKQSWCDGRVATTGTSYTANTSLYSLVTGHKALRMAVCRAPDFDAYRFLVAPGGVVNHWFIEVWGKITAAQDKNDVKALFDGDYWPVPASGINNLLGVRPIDTDADGSLLEAAIVEHQNNFNLSGLTEKFTFRDPNTLGTYRDLFDPCHQRKIELNQIPTVIRCGWHDAGTALGALSMFCSFDCPIQVILGPWNHGGDFRADPFQSDYAGSADAIEMEQAWQDTVQSLGLVFNESCQSKSASATEKEFRQIKYFTLGENAWKTTPIWPLPKTVMQRWYFAQNHQLVTDPPEFADAADYYKVDPTTGTGTDNRWHAQSPAKPILFPDRREEDKKLLVYDSAPLEQSLEITGHPIIHLYVRSTATDGQFFVYLETIDPDGRVRLLTEGQLRGLHRRVSKDPPPYTMFGPYHSFAEKDAAPMVTGEVTEISFDLFPISVLLKKGQRIRLAIAGADKDVFADIDGCESPEIFLQRNRSFSSCLELPIV